MSPARLPLSVCVITRDEEDRIGDCLDSVAFAEDVVVLDSGSTDRTREIARAKGARVFEQPFLGHVAQKQRAVDLARYDWVLCLDADERVDRELRAAIEEALREPGGTAGFAVARRVHYLGGFLRYGGWGREWRVRLFDRRRGRWAGRDPHDRVEVDGPVRRLPGFLLHYNYRDLSHHLRKIDLYTDLLASEGERLGTARLLFRLVTRPPARFAKIYILRLGFLDGTRGFVVAWMGAFYVFLKYAKQWQRRHT